MVSVRLGRVTSAYVEELLQRIQQLERALLQTPVPLHPTANLSPESHGPSTFIPGPGEPSSCQQPATAVGDRQQQDDDTARERCLPEPVPIPSRPPPASLPSPTATPHGRLSTALFPVENWMGLNWFFNGIPIFSEQGCQWVSQRTGQGVEVAKLLDRGLSNRDPAWHMPPESSRNLPFCLERCGLPDKDTVANIFAVYFKSAFRLVFPVLHRTLFEETLELAYETVDTGALLSSPKHISARACVLSAMSVVSRLKETRSVSHTVNPVECMRHAKYLVLCNTGDASLVTLQAILMMVRPSMPNLSDPLSIHALTPRLPCQISVAKLEWILVCTAHLKSSLSECLFLSFTRLSHGYKARWTCLPPTLASSWR